MGKKWLKSNKLSAFLPKCFYLLSTSTLGYMTINFAKYQGTGNDFILIDDRLEEFDLHNHALVARLCHRRFGIGADGLILLRYHETSDFKMAYFNADGQPGSMCGNGARCLAAFARELGILHHKATFFAPDGFHEAHYEGSNVALSMKNVAQATHHPDHYFIDTGSPHYVAFAPNVQQLEVEAQGRAICHGPMYGQQGTNVNFVEMLGPHQIFVRTYERGVEAETLSCGTGVTASAIATAIAGQLPDGPHQIEVHTRGGNLAVSMVREGGQFTHLWLKGPAEKVFEGSLTV